jgi:putative methyltransferase (TIGR04325 family)
MGSFKGWRSTYGAHAAGRIFTRAMPYLPAILVKKINYVLSDWVYVPEGWRPQRADMKGWSDPGVAGAVAQHWPSLVRNLQGPGPLGVAHFPWSLTREDAGYHNAMMSYGYVLALAARMKDRISVLDWGGGAGHYYLYSKALLPEVEIEYHCYDVRPLCEVGAELQPEVHFHHDARDLAGRQYDLVISSSALHYFEDWQGALRQLTAATREFLYLARLQIVSRSPSFVVEQRPYRSGYYTQCLSWFLNRQELVTCAEESGLELVREFVFLERWAVRGAPEKQEGRGFLFRRRPGSGRDEGHEER